MAVPSTAACESSFPLVDVNVAILQFFSSAVNDNSVLL